MQQPNLTTQFEENMLKHVKPSTIKMNYKPKLNKMAQFGLRQDPNTFFLKTIIEKWPVFMADMRERLAASTMGEYMKLFLCLYDFDYPHFREYVNQWPEWIEKVRDAFTEQQSKILRDFPTSDRALPKLMLSTSDFNDVFNETFDESKKEDREAMLIIRLYLWWPARNDFIMRILEEEPAADVKFNYILLPKDPVEKARIHFNAFKTEAYAARYIFDRQLPNSLTAAVRQYIKDKRRLPGDWLFGSKSEEVTRQILVDALLRMGFGEAAGVNLMRKLAASNMADEVRQGTKTEADEANLARIMAHSMGSHQVYIRPLCDRTMFFGKNIGNDTNPSKKQRV